MAHSHAAHDQENESKTLFGFWVYLLTDFMFFATLFATFIVLQKSTFGGPSGKELFHLPFTLVQTLILLMSAFTSGLASVTANRKEKKSTIIFFALTFLLGATFMGMEFSEFSTLLSAGHGWQKSAFLSMYYTLVGTHGVHVLIGLLWTLLLLIPVWREGLTATSMRRLFCLTMFWQFLNVIWIFIFALVYLLGGQSV
jgi:cytochrome o ubiquinol oxidase subunit 3